MSRLVRPNRLSNVSLWNVYGPVEVVLTRAVVCSIVSNNLALSVTDLFSDLHSKPRGNGEDIILSFAALAASRKANVAYPFSANKLPLM